MIKHQKTKGYLLLLAAFLVTIGALLVATVCHVITNQASTATNDLDTVDAFYIANAGMQRALYRLNTSTLADKIKCNDITNNNHFNEIDFEHGQFDVTANLYSATNATLMSAISLSTTTIPVSTLTHYTASGQVMIDNEVINYANYSASSADCAGNAPCLLGATRGVGTTDTALHSSGSAIVQYRCHITSTGAIPNLSSPKGKRIISIDSFGIEQGWVVGKKKGSKKKEEVNIIQWDENNWSPFTPLMRLPSKDFNAIFIINYIDGWAVGQKDGKDSLLIHWNGSDWINSSTKASKEDLNGITCASSNDCWAVGKKKTFLHWNGSTWNAVKLNKSIPNKTISAVTCISTDDCWAVGEKDKKNVVIVHWNGAEWNLSSSSTKETLNGIDCISTSDCWAVGKKKNFNHWNGSSWSKVSAASNVPNKDINSVSCTSSNNCWAVGSQDKKEAVFVHWNGATWSRINDDGTLGDKKLNSVYCLTDHHCWATGDKGAIAYWDGSSWTNGAIGTVSDKKLNAITMLGSVDNRGPYIANWLEE